MDSTVMRPIVTIAMPVFNGGETLAWAVESVLRQTFQDWELLLIDDGSTDDAISSLAIRDPRITIIQDQMNLGLAARLNQAIHMAKGQYFCRMDHDDYSHPERLERQVRHLIAHSEIDLLGTACVTIDETNQILGTLPLRHSHAEICARPWATFYVPHPSWMGKLSWFKANCYAEPAPYCAEDQELLLRAHKNSIYMNLPETLLAYRVRGWTSSDKLWKTRKSIFSMQRAYFCKQKEWFNLLAAACLFVFRIAFDFFRFFKSKKSNQVSVAEQLRWNFLPTGKKSVLFVATTPFAINAFWLSHLLALARKYRVTVATNMHAYALLDAIQGVCQVKHIPIERKIRPLSDLKALVALCILMRQVQPASVHSMTPKAGLLTMTSGLIMRIPHRFHTFTGQVWATASGVKRFILMQFDKLIAQCATQVFTDSPSQSRFIERERIVPPGAARILGEGSISGVDLTRFHPDLIQKSRLREKLGVSDSACVFLFVGRLTRDKGVFDLLEAYSRLAPAHTDLSLWVVGPDEDNLLEVLQEKAQALRVSPLWLGATPQPERFMQAADVLVLPSYREGFGTVIIEAAACQLPSIAYRVDGVIDAIEDGYTGMLVPLHDRIEFALAMQKLLENRAFRHQLSLNALNRVQKNFSSETVTKYWLEFYEKTV